MLVLLSAFTSYIVFPLNCDLHSILIHSLQVLDRIISGVEEFGFCNKGWIESPIKGAEGNKEFLACFHRIRVSESQQEREIEAKEPVT
jgi:23S rRNA (cytidine1920-2'-O)/16S rRNA (cytidine1409-2'-O)-methyltransferase